MCCVSFENSKSAKTIQIIILLIIYSIIIFKGYNFDATFTLSRRGQLKLVFNQYEFTRVRSSRRNLVTTWRCALPHSFPQYKCEVKAFTKHFGQKQLVKIMGEHTHPPEKQEELRQRKKAKTSIPPFAII